MRIHRLASLLISLGLAAPLAHAEEAAAPARPSSLSAADLGKLVEALRGVPERPLKVRLQAALIMGRVGGLDAGPALAECLENDADYPVRGACALALGNLGDVHAAEALVVHLDDSEELVRDECRRSLLKLARPEALPYLQAARERGSSRVRAVLVEVVAQIKDAESGLLLAELLGDPEREVQKAAEVALNTMDPGAANLLLMKGLDHPSYRVRERCAAILGAHKHALAVDRLSELATSPLEAVEVQRSARGALREMRSLFDIPRLTALARDARADRKDRVHSLALLAALGGSDALQVCLEVLADAEESMRGSASQALAELGDPRALASLREALAKPENTRINKVIAVSIRKLERGSAQ